MASTPDMALPLASVLVTEGPTWATIINSAFSRIDGHSHTSGSGLAITPFAMDMDADLTFNETFNLTQARSARLYEGAILTNAADVSCAYSVAGDFYWNSADGTALRFTNGHNVIGGTVGNITGLISPASASFTFGTGGVGSGNGTFSWIQDTSWYSGIVGGAYQVFSNTGPLSSPQGVTLQSPTSLGTAYTLTLPSLPPSSQIRTGLLSVVKSTGAITYGNVDNVTLQLVNNTFSIKSVPGSLINANSVPIYALERANFMQSDTTGPGIQVIDGLPQQVVDGLQVFNFVASGKHPILVEVMQDGGTQPGYWLLSNTSNHPGQFDAQFSTVIANGSTTIFNGNFIGLGGSFIGPTTGSYMIYQPNMCKFVWTGAINNPGTYSFQIYAGTAGGPSSSIHYLQAFNLKLFVQEMV